MIGRGFTSALIARQLMPIGVYVVVLVRGVVARKPPPTKSPVSGSSSVGPTSRKRAEHCHRDLYRPLQFSETALPARRLEAFIPGESVSAQSITVMFRVIVGPYTILPCGRGSKVGMAVFRTICWCRTVVYLRGARALSRSLGKAIWHYRQSRQLARSDSVGGNPFEAPRQNVYPQSPL